MGDVLESFRNPTEELEIDPQSMRTGLPSSFGFADEEINTLKVNNIDVWSLQALGTLILPVGAAAITPPLTVPTDGSQYQVPLATALSQFARIPVIGGQFNTPVPGSYQLNVNYSLTVTAAGIWKVTGCLTQNGTIVITGDQIFNGSGNFAPQFNTLFMVFSPITSANQYGFALKVVGTTACSLTLVDAQIAYQGNYSTNTILTPQPPVPPQVPPF